MKCLFHLAFKVTDLDQGRRFYGGVPGGTEGRSTDTWVDFDFFGRQLSQYLGEPFKAEGTDPICPGAANALSLKASRTSSGPRSFTTRLAI